MGLHLRWAIPRDLPEILAIDAASFPAPWSEEDYRCHLRQRNEIGMVVEDGELIVGAMLYALHKEKLELLRLAVHPGHRLNGVGAAMIAKLVTKLSSHRRTRVVADVCERNTPAHLFFRAQGFHATTVLRDHEEAGRDAYRMEYLVCQREDSVRVLIAE